MKFEDNAIYWIASARQPAVVGRVTRAVFQCNGTMSDILRAEVTCEDANSIYAFAFARADQGYAGNCTIWSAATHAFKNKQDVVCTIINNTEGGALLLSGNPMKVNGRSDLYWLARIKFVTREFC